MGEPTAEEVVAAPHPRLRPFVAEYVGYRLSGFAPGTYVGLPSRWITFVVALDGPVDVSSDPSGADRERYWGMLAGLHARPALVHHQGEQHGIELAVTPQGASALFGLPVAELASTQVHLDQVVPQFAHELVERLADAVSWRARWAVLDDVLVRMVRAETHLRPELEQAWATLTATHGAISVEQLAREVGCSRRHLSQKFHTTFGLAPKVMGRVLRFEQAQQLLQLPTQPSLASVAAACGYADQSHMTRDWNEFAGTSPSSWMTTEVIPFVQDNSDPKLPSLRA